MIIEGAKSLGIHVPDHIAVQFSIHARELLTWNRKINLTAITDPLEIAVKHFLDSIAPVPLIPESASVLDIGSGGGFPGIPLKLLLPSSPFTLLESSQKKTSFLKHITRTLHLRDTEIICARAEAFAGKEDDKRAFDVIICRALSSMDNFVSMASPLVAKGGIIIAMKGKKGDKEAGSISPFDNRRGIHLCGRTEFSLTSKKYTLPYLGAERTIITLQKKHHSYRLPKNYSH